MCNATLLRSIGAPFGIEPKKRTPPAPAPPPPPAAPPIPEPPSTPEAGDNSEVAMTQKRGRRKRGGQGGFSLFGAPGQGGGSLLG